MSGVLYVPRIGSGGPAGTADQVEAERRALNAIALLAVLRVRVAASIVTVYGLGKREEIERLNEGASDILVSD